MSKKPNDQGYGCAKEGIDKAVSRITVALKELSDDAATLALTAALSKDMVLVSEALMLQELVDRLSKHLKADTDVLYLVIAEKEAK